MTFADRRLSLLALLGMVNYTPQWVRPHGRLSAGEIADGYCAMVLRATRSLKDEIRSAEARVTYK